MSTKIHVKLNDTAAVYTLTLRKGRELLDLSDVATAFLLCRRYEDADGVALDPWDLVVDLTGSNINTTDSTVDFQFAAGDWVSDFEAGKYKIEVELTMNDATVLTVPTVGYYEMEIQDDLD